MSEWKELSVTFRGITQQLNGVNTGKQLAHWANQHPRQAEQLILTLLQIGVKMGEELDTQNKAE